MGSEWREHSERMKVSRLHHRICTFVCLFYHTVCIDTSFYIALWLLSFIAILFKNNLAFFVSIFSKAIITYDWPDSVIYSNLLSYHFFFLSSNEVLVVLKVLSLHKWISRYTIIFIDDCLICISTLMIWDINKTLNFIWLYSDRFFFFVWNHRSISVFLM